ncbi:transferase [Marivirga sp. S37H4]|uniref:Transferase n=1 Tax=Marivirga aurantiaca TaxID=2802615 RepID=A0A934WZP4_9BACT|nr:transferase [Marivirga aurantiaca]MBK6265770.1 transferase [Marivirga aurantiaca]
MYLLFPGRHHLLTQFQFDYLQKIIQEKSEDKIVGIVFAVTSANHSGTKRNPIPFYLRAMMIQEFCEYLPAKSYVFGIDDVGELENFASYTLKQIQHQSEQKLQLNAENTLLICSTPVMEMYKKLGFKVLTAELQDEKYQSYQTALPWELVESISEHTDWAQANEIVSLIHQASKKIWQTYSLDEKVRNILNDPIIGEDGDITESRDYNSYVRQMDEIAEIKYKDTARYIKPGIIGDIGCAVGSWIKQASEDPRFRESDFYGIEVARQLYEICLQRKNNREFGNPYVFFAQKNAVTSFVFQKESMNTIHTSSLTHEIESYGNRQDLLKFISNRYEELQSGGVWINRDVIGPENGSKTILMQLTTEDGRNDDFDLVFSDNTLLAEYLGGLSTYALFKRFCMDFRKTENDQISYNEIHIEGDTYFELALKDAAEFMLTKDYHDNWNSEMHERFCFWSFSEWKATLESFGFRVEESSSAYANPWIVQNRFENKVQLFDKNRKALDYPPTNVLLLASKI